MRSRTSCVLLLLVVLLVTTAFAAPITPTTTLAAETGSNTSTAATFATSSNGNLGGANVSKVDHRTLLYPGANTNMFVHLMMWWGSSWHNNIGYNSGDSALIQKQVTDMMSRGITGAVIDWYGPGSYEDGATAPFYKYTNSLPNTPFKVAIMEDAGAVNGSSNPTQKVIDDLTYVYNNYMNTSAYMRLNGRPVVMFFAVEEISGINWDTIKAKVPGNPLFIFENSGGFTRADTDGGFAWVQINTSNKNDWGQGYVDDFYSTAKKYPAEHTFVSAWKGFNDTVASWSANRIMNQNCGQTWLSTWNEIAKYYSSANQAESMQIVTWNDYEEGTAIETGIDNCVSVSASVSGSTLNWTITGNENTLDHYEVFASTDGTNLAKLISVAAGIHTADLTQFNLDPATYKLYVKAVGKPSMTNHMSAAVNYTAAGGTTSTAPPQVSVTATPSAAVAPASVAANVKATPSGSNAIKSYSISFGDGSAAVSAASASHTYSTPGTYTVTASATDSAGQTGTATTSVTITANKAPVATVSVNPANGTTGVVVTASSSGSYDSDGNIASSSINFGDGSAAVNATTASHTYNVTGTYTVTATVTDDKGAKASASATVTVTAPVATAPTASLTVTPANTTTGVNVSATLTGTETNGTIASYKIDFGDGTVANSATATHAYSALGTYTVTGTVTDAKGATATAQKTVTVVRNLKRRRGFTIIQRATTNTAAARIASY